MKVLVMLVVRLICANMNEDIYLAKDMLNKTQNITVINGVEYYSLRNEFIKKAYVYYKDNYEYTGKESQEYIIEVYLGSVG